MAKRCAVCKKTYSDREPSCPYCAEAVDVVEAVEDTPRPAKKPKGKETAAMKVDVADVVDDVIEVVEEAKPAAGKKGQAPPTKPHKVAPPTQLGSKAAPRTMLAKDDEDVIEVVEEAPSPAKGGKPTVAAQAQKGKPGQPTQLAGKGAPPTMLAPQGEDEDIIEAVEEVAAADKTPKPQAKAKGTQPEYPKTKPAAVPGTGHAGDAVELGARGKRSDKDAVDIEAIDLVTGEMLAETSAVNLGATPGKSDKPSGLDLIAEAVDSGLEMESGKSGKKTSAATSDDGSQPGVSEDTEDSLFAGTGKGKAGKKPATKGEEIEVVDDEGDGELVGAGAGKAKTKPMPKPKYGRRWLGGALLGILLAVGGVAGAWYLKYVKIPLLDKEEKTSPISNLTKKSDVEIAHQLMDDRKYKEAVDALKATQSAEGFNLRAQANWMLYLSGQQGKKAPLNPKDPLVVAALNDLDKAKNALYLGQVNGLVSYSQLQSKLAGKDVDGLLKAQTEADAVRTTLKGNPVAEEMNKGLADLNLGVKQVADALKDKTTLVSTLQAALKTAGYDAKTAKDLANQLAKLIKDKDADNTILASLATQLKVGKDKLFMSLKNLETAKKTADGKLQKVQVSLESAVAKDRLKGKEPFEGIDLLAADKKMAELGRAKLQALIDQVRARLKDAKILVGDFTKDDVLLAGLDAALKQAATPLVTVVAKVADTIGTAGAQVARTTKGALDLSRWTARREAMIAFLRARELYMRSPAKMLDQWLILLQDRDRADAAQIATTASNDANFVIKRNLRADALTKAKAHFVLALALRNQMNYVEAKANLDQALTTGTTAGWQKDAAAVRLAMTETAGYYHRFAVLKRTGQYDKMLSEIAAGLKIVSGKGSLLALSSLVRLDKARAADAKLDATNPGITAARKDAQDAITASASEEGSYALGRIAEELGDLAAALKHFEVAAKFKANKELAGLYQLALARVLLQTKPEAEPKKDDKGKGDKTKVRAERKSINKVATSVEVGARPLARTKVQNALAPAAIVLLLQNLLTAENKDQALVALYVQFCKPAAFKPAYVRPPIYLAIKEEDEPTTLDNKNADRAIKLAQEIIANFPNRKGEGYLIWGEALTKKGLWTEGLKKYLDGLRILYPNQTTSKLAEIIRDHPLLQIQESVKPPQPLLAEKHYNLGLNYYWMRNYPKAEVEFQLARKFFDKDARYLYFLGLSQLQQKTPAKVGAAYENFRTAKQLEDAGNPDPADVNDALERIQGKARRVLNGFRKP